MALYELTLRQSYMDQLCINTFGYITDNIVGSTPNALELVTLFGGIPTGDPLNFPSGTVMREIIGVQDSDVLTLSLECKELYSVTDFYEAVYSPPIAGSQTANQGLPPFAAWGFYSARVRLDIRRSFKRFVGVPEQYVSNGGIVADEIVPDLVDISDAMGATLDGVTAFYYPCTISRQRVVDPEDGKVSYELYPTESEQEEHVAFPLVWTHYGTIRSQVSRQYGRGQ